MRESYSDDEIRAALEKARIIAMVGASKRPARPSHGVMRFLQERGHRVIPVNPGYAGETIHGERVYARLAEVPEAIDMVDIFRRSAEAGAAVDAAIARGARIVWMQLDVVDEAAASRARAAGLTVIMDRCPVIEYRRLGL
ncbi:MAG: CoA-binding protein [Alphaproteobacteria bacterium]|nr:CoA-binding protein [Alphaproteobacteria bacterium]